MRESISNGKEKIYSKKCKFNKRWIIKCERIFSCFPLNFPNIPNQCVNFSHVAFPLQRMLRISITEMSLENAEKNLLRQIRSSRDDAGKFSHFLSVIRFEHDLQRFFLCDNSWASEREQKCIGSFSFFFTFRIWINLFDKFWWKAFADEIARFLFQIVVWPWVEIVSIEDLFSGTTRVLIRKITI